MAGNPAADLGLRIVAALLILLVCWTIVRVVAGLVRRLLKWIKLDEQIGMVANGRLVMFERIPHDVVEEALANITLVDAIQPQRLHILVDLAVLECKGRTRSRSDCFCLLRRSVLQYNSYANTSLWPVIH